MPSATDVGSAMLSSCEIRRTFGYRSGFLLLVLQRPAIVIGSPL